MERLDLTTPNFTDENIQKLSELFPNCVTEDSNGRVIDFDALRQELSSNIIEGNKERYQLTWPGKAESLVTANMPINKTLRPNREESKDFDNTENLYIEGDNLEVLKLLQETYLGKVKMIYIDPPYNTGNDFVYKDNFTQDKAEYDEESGNINDEGGRLVSNPDSNGRYHSDWLSMMYPRLKLARNLLKDDGVIFISIDDNEVHNLRKICDEIFGEGNFIDVLKWKRKKQPSFLARHTAKVMEYVLIYAKVNQKLEKISISGTSDSTKKVINNTNNISIRFFKEGVRVKLGENGVIKAGEYQIRTMTIEYLQDVYYVDGYTTNSVDVKARFSTSQNNIENYIDNDLLFITSNTGLRRDVSDDEIGKRKSITDLCLQDWGDNQESDNEMRVLFNTVEYFDYTKPTLLIKNLIKSIYSDGEIVLDFFSGSATTSHSVMRLNAEDSGNRKFIIVQLPEAINKESTAFNDGYKTIAEIGKERIRRAGEKIKEDNADKEGIDDLDIGFRVLKVDSSNMKKVYFSPDNTSQDDMFDLASNIKDDRTDEDLLFMVLLDWGIDLSVKIERREVVGKTVYFADDDYLAACFTDNIDENFVKAVVAEQPRKVVLRDSGFASSSVKINVEQIFKQADIEVKVI